MENTVCIRSINSIDEELRLPACILRQYSSTMKEESRDLRNIAM